MQLIMEWGIDFHILEKWWTRLRLLSSFVPMGFLNFFLGERILANTYMLVVLLHILPISWVSLSPCMAKEMQHILI